ncbi:alpha/beta fold hydrolase [Actinomycetospora termitidis]|uniref:Alpha/beta fold hydrolase n=1 Tax=Actinomycetospora termitidis TaxID=3053470 RepID=A0ABT7M408_9PSEU|nr:alpha/beta fold hydrolase [Actinomycetospora sp. Odt1-22]MDL5155401.1 alpha/beta fold hydrolase [Actinomycetospora sp. Odt1-22]
MPRLTAFTHGSLRFDVTDAGPEDADETVLLLHGFPQTSVSWDPVATRLHDAGLRTLAPDQRGYSPGARPSGRRAYRVENLVDDAAALVESSGAGSVHVVGHDWGAVVAWALAAHRPELVRTVTGVSVPHPAAFLRAMYAGPQLPHSWYMGAFQLPRLPELLLGDEGRFAAMLRRTGATPGNAARDAAALAAHITGPLNWYRALPLASPGYTARPVQRPALQVWSDGDDFITRAAVENNPRFVTAPYRLEVLSGVSHWIPDEAPDELAAMVVRQTALAG